MISDVDNDPDESMTPEESALAASLSEETIRKIDTGLVSLAKSENRKVDMLVAMAMTDPELRILGLPDVFYASRVKKLVDRGLLIAHGNLDRMRYSEVRLP